MQGKRAVIESWKYAVMFGILKIIRVAAYCHSLTKPITIRIANEARKGILLSSCSARRADRAAIKDHNLKLIAPLGASSIRYYSKTYHD